MKYVDLNLKSIFYRASRLNSAARFVFEQNRILFFFDVPTYKLP